MIRSHDYRPSRTSISRNLRDSVTKRFFKDFAGKYLGLIVCLCIFPPAVDVQAGEVPASLVKIAVEHWVRHITADPRPDAVIREMEPYTINGKTIAYIAHLKGGGFCLCGADDTLTLPVYLYSPHGMYDPENPGFQLVFKQISDTIENLERLVREDAPEVEKYRTTLESRASLWQDLIDGRLITQDETLSTLAASPQQMALPLTTLWQQGTPFNNFCPMGNGGRSLVGCAATAMAQIMKFWEWPASGNTSSSYTWDGDQSCGGSVGGGTLSATYSDSYDWRNMPDDCAGGCTAAERNALAELCYEIGVSVEMDYGRCESGTPLFNFVLNGNPLVNHFRYDSDATYNSDFAPPVTDADTIITEIQWFRPVEIGGCLNSNGGAHYWVILGYNDGYDPPQFLMNMGWGGPHSWNTWDAVANSCHNYITQIAPANTVRFVGNTTTGDGSPDNPHENIEEAIQQAPDGATLIFKAGSDNTFSTRPLVVTKPLTIKGHNVTIQ